MINKIFDIISIKVNAKSPNKHYFDMSKKSNTDRSPSLLQLYGITHFQISLENIFLFELSHNYRNTKMRHTI